MAKSQKTIATTMNRMAIPTYPAGSLLYALVIVTVLAMTSVALITISSYQRSLFDRDDLQERLTRMAVEGTGCLLANPSLTEKQPVLMHMGADGADTLWLERQSWGLFDLCIAKAWRQTKWHKEEVMRIGFIGMKPDSSGQSALYLQENAKPLVLTGNSVIRGDAFLPRGGIRAGYVNTEGFTGKKLLDGVEKHSSRRMPPLDEQRLTFLLHAFEMYSTSISGDRFEKIQSTVQVAFDSTSRIIKGRVLNLSKKKINGKVILIADSLIYVGKGAQLNDVLLFAPEIRIDSSFAGTLQAFATKNIHLGKSVVLAYPSVVAILQPADAKERSTCFIAEHCRIEGLVLSWSNNARKNLLPAIFADVGSIIMGQIYSDGSLELRGAVHGNVTCRSFILNTPASIFENHLMNAVIDVTERPATYAGPVVCGDHAARGVVLKWLKQAP